MLLLLLSLAAPVPQPSAASTAEGLASILSSSLFHESVARLRELPLLCSGYAEQQTASSRKTPLGLQPTKGLMDETMCLVKAVTSSVVDHIAEAIALDHPLASLHTAAEDDDLQAAVGHVAAFAGLGHSALKEHRHALATVLRRVERDLRPLSVAARAIMPSSVRHLSHRYNVPFIAALVASIDWPDTALAECFCAGFPIVGLCPVSGVPSFVVVDRPPEIPDIRGLGNAAWNRALRDRVRGDFSAGRCPHAEVLWSKTMEEVAKGLCFGPFTLEQMDERFGGSDAWRAMLRFAVEQTKPDGTCKVRPCDDAASSLHNEATSLGETIACETADFPARVAALFVEALGLDGDWSMLGGTEDVEGAYRQCPVRTPQFTAFALVDPSTGQGRFFFLPGMNLCVLPSGAAMRRRCPPSSIISSSHLILSHLLARPSVSLPPLSSHLLHRSSPRLRAAPPPACPSSLLALSRLESHTSSCSSSSSSQWDGCLGQPVQPAAGAGGPLPPAAVRRLCDALL